MNESLALRELLRRSQSNVTHNPELGLEYATAAYERASQPENRQTDPTAAGEAAAKAGFRDEQAGRDSEEVADWFTTSYQELKSDSPGVKRERIATHILEGRVLALRCLGNLAVDDTVKKQASRTFHQGDNLVLEQHEKGQRWDPYATMLSRHWATHEAISGSTGTAAGLAIQGVLQAILSRQETANTPAGKLKHVVFVGKQVALNYAAGLLALSKPLDSSFRKQRESAARWLLS